MATVKEIKISQTSYKRPNPNIYNAVWYVEIGEEYKAVSFSINELNKPYLWIDTLCVPIDWTEEKINETVREYVKNISEEDVEAYRNFLEDGERWGWD